MHIAQGQRSWLDLEMLTTRQTGVDCPDSFQAATFIPGLGGYMGGSGVCARTGYPPRG